jgi:chlorophyllide a reductase subunit Y
MGPAGTGSLAQVINTAIGNKERFARMESFFDGVGEGDTHRASGPRGAEGRAA